jgi:hypothetical protein
MSIVAFWVVTPCKLVDCYQHFGETCCLQSILKIEDIRSSEMLITTYKISEKGSDDGVLQ